MGIGDYLSRFGRGRRANQPEQVKVKAEPQAPQQESKSYLNNGDYTFLVRHVRGDVVEIKTRFLNKPRITEDPEFKRLGLCINDVKFQRFNLRMKDIYRVCPELAEGQQLKRDDVVKYEPKKFYALLGPTIAKATKSVLEKKARELDKELGEDDLVVLDEKDELGDLKTDSSLDLDLKIDDSSSSLGTEGFNLKDDDIK